MTAHDKNEEAMLLGEIITSGDLSKATADTFKDPNHKIVFQTMQNLAKAETPISLSALHAALVDAGDLEKIGGASYLPSITMSTIQLITTRTSLSEETLKNISKETTEAPKFQKEGNAIEYPMAVLNPKQKGSVTEGNYVVYYAEDRTLISKVGTHDGPLMPFDYEAYTYMHRYYRETPDGKGVIAFTDYDLLKQMGLPTNGASYECLRKAKKKFASLHMVAPKYIRRIMGDDGKWKSKQAGVVGLTFFPTYYITNLKGVHGDIPKGDDELLHFNYFVVNDAIRDNFRACYAFWLNHKILLELGTPLKQRLYEIIIKRSGTKKIESDHPVYEESLKSFCKRLPLGLNRMRNTKNILAKALDVVKSKDSAAFHKYTFTKDSAGDDVIRIVYHQRGKDQAIALTLGSQEKEALDALIKAGVNGKAAMNLVKKYPAHGILQQIKSLEYRKPKNKAALLVSSIKKAYPMTAAEEASRHRARPSTSASSARGGDPSKISMPAYLKEIEKKYMGRGNDSGPVS